MPRPLLFKEQLIYEQLASQSVHGLRENLTCVWSRQPLKIEQLNCKQGIAGMDGAIAGPNRSD
jgi:hypothetical protein